MLSKRISRRAERAFIAVVFVLAVVCAEACARKEVGRTSALRRSDRARPSPAPATPLRRPDEVRPSPAPAALVFPTAVDDHLWSPKRIQAYRDSLRQPFPAPLAVLRIPRAAIEAPVLAGTDDATLNRGVGWIQGTAGPGEAGNVGIAGHRDGFFRGLKDVVDGDAITIVTPEGPQEYVVEDVRIVAPEDVSVLEATSAPTLTLVTCYPFYFVGDAPKRYIVRAVRRRAAAQEDSSPR